MASRFPLIVKCAKQFENIGRDTTAATVVHFIGIRGVDPNVRVYFPDAKILRIEQCDANFPRYQVSRWTFPKLSEIFIVNSTEKPLTTAELMKGYFCSRVKVHYVI